MDMADQAGEKRSGRFAVRQNAGPGERFGPNAFASNVGQVYEVGTLVGVKVVDDGAAVVLTFEGSLTVEAIRPESISVSRRRR